MSCGPVSSETGPSNKRFKFPIRTTPEGEANAYQDLKGNDLESGLLSTEEAEGYELAKPAATV
jgi:adenylylsulfate reductase subunit B